MARGAKSTEIPPVVQRFVKTLIVTHKAVALYPPASNIPLDTAKDAAAALRAALGESSELRLTVDKQGLYYLGTQLFPGNPAYSSLAYELFARNLADVRFHAGTTNRDIVAFLSVLRHPPEAIRTAGGYEGRLWELGVGTITVTEASVALVDGGQGGASGKPEVPRMLSREEIDRLLAAAYGGRQRDQVTLSRLIGDSDLVSSYLTATFADSAASGLLEVGERFSELAEVAYASADSADRQRLLKSLGAALQSVSPEMRAPLLLDELLPEARANEAIASVIRQLELEDICRMLVEGLHDSDISRDAVARAIRTLAQISTVDRMEIVGAAGAAMRAAGISDEVLDEVIAAAAPGRLHIRGLPGVAGHDRPVDTVFRLMDIAAAGPAREAGDQESSEGSARTAELEALREEAAQGVTDGDVIMTLLSLVTLDPNEQSFASTMAMLEDALDLLIERGEIEVAAAACDALDSAAANASLDDSQRERLRRAKGHLTKPEDMRELAHALRTHAPGTREHEAAAHILSCLGSLAVIPLLEQLAEEADMSVRKSVIDMLAVMAPDNIAVLGDRIGDPRWYVVRNIVAILGSTRSPAVVQYIERTLQHPEPRVRREAVRALSGIADRRAADLLIAMLADEDAQNVQLAARYLGTLGVHAAVPALDQVARGEGRGNRDTGPRVEAIEALGRLRAASALPTLQGIARRRALAGGTRSREVRAAAEAAIAKIQAEGGGR